MSRRLSYLIVIAGVVSFLPTGLRAQASTPLEREMYCAGIATTQPVHPRSYIVSGQESGDHIVYSQGDKVFINRGARDGVKVGDQFLVSRVESESLPYPWFKDQPLLTRTMGKFVADIGRMRAVNVQERMTVAEITLACDYVQRGDIVEPFVERPAPQFKADTKLDLYAPPSGKAQGRIVFTNQFGEAVGGGKIVYVNLGTSKGAKVGDYLRIFRNQGETDETEFNYPNMSYSTFGFGSAPQPYSSKQLPRDVLGEGIVLRVSPTSAAVLITNGHVQIFPGDHVEIE